MVFNRPPFVKITSIVRDAAARLPNDCGTRADVTQLVRDSQWVLKDATDEELATTVSGSLDRLQAEHDPCVMFHTNHKIWIYLHNRRDGVSDPKWELDQAEINSMAPAIKRVLDLYRTSKQ